MRGEIKRLHQEIATTMIYVTHDQIEAMTLADRIVLMRDGRDRAAGRATRPVRAAGLDLRRWLPRLAAHEFSRRHAGRQAARAPPFGSPNAVLPLAPGRALNGARDGQAVLLGLRPEHLTRAQTAQPLQQASSAMSDDRPDAADRVAQLRHFPSAGAPVMAELQAHDVSRPGEKLAIDINMNRASIFDAGTERAL